MHIYIPKTTTCVPPNIPEVEIFKGTDCAWAAIMHVLAASGVTNALATPAPPRKGRQNFAQHGALWAPLAVRRRLKTSQILKSCKILKKACGVGQPRA